MYFRPQTTATAPEERFAQGEVENRTFRSRLGVQPALEGFRILDVGCGNGRLCVGEDAIEVRRAFISPLLVGMHEYLRKLST